MKVLDAVTGLLICLQGTLSAEQQKAIDDALGAGYIASVETTSRHTLALVVTDPKTGERDVKWATQLDRAGRTVQ